ncbi:MAG: ParB/RepB/Spo0J family partition protein [Clostridia bacterium]
MLKDEGADKLIRLDVELIDPGDAGRRDLVPESIAALAESIAQVGLLEPIIVRRVGERFQLIAGKRRLLAVKSLAHSQIDALIHPANAREAALFSLIENVQRAALHYLDEARALAELMLVHAYTQQSLGRALGMSQSAMANKLRLLKLPQQVQEALLSAPLTERHARALLKLTDEPLQLRIIDQCAREKWSVRKLEASVEQLRREKQAPRPYRVYLRDQRMLVNAVLNTVKTLNAAGVMATSRVEEMEDRIDIVVSLPLRAQKSAPAS